MIHWVYPEEEGEAGLKVKMVRCESCGKLIDEQAKVCPACGVSRTEEDLLHPIRVNRTPPAQTKPAAAAKPAVRSSHPVHRPGEAAPVPERREEVRTVPGKRQAKRSLRTPLIIGAVVLAVLIGLFVFLKGKRDREKYIADLQTAVETIQSSTAETERCGLMIQKVWTNAVSEIRDLETDKYTRNKNGFGSFKTGSRDAVDSLLADPDFSARLKGISDDLYQVVSMVNRLGSPPKEYEEAYEDLKALYTAYRRLAKCVTDPTGTLSTFTQEFTAADNDVLACYKTMLTRLAELE